MAYLRTINESDLKGEDDSSYQKVLHQERKSLESHDNNLQKEQKNRSKSKKDELITRYASDFMPQPPKKERKTQPFFHDNLETKDFKVSQYMVIPSVPAYSPVDEGMKTVLESRLKKYPYAHKKLVTIEDMRKPKISLLGVLPVRACSDIQTLNVVLEGASALEYTSVARAAPKLYNTPASSFVFADNSLGEINETKTKSDTQSAPKKPAILPGMGTTVLKLCERMKPIKISYLHQRKKSKRPKTKSPNMAASCQSSFSSTELNLTDDTTYTTNNETPEVLFAGESIETYIGLEKETERDELTSGNTVKSVKELLEEAKLISLATSEPLYIKNANRYISNKEEGLLEKNQMDKGNNIKRNPVKENTKISSQNQKEKTFSNVVDTVEIKRAERTVDEIIASLKDQTAYNQETDADRKIKEIMQRVMSRTNIEVEETFDETKTERNESSALITESDQEPDKQVSSLHYFDDAKLEIDDIPTADTGTYNSNDLMTDDPVSFGSKSIADRSPLSISELNFTKTDDNGIKESEILDEHLRQTREEINYEQMRNDLLLPPEATVEDLLSIKGELKEFQERLLPFASTSLKHNSLIPSISFLSTSVTTVPKSFNNDMDSRKTQEKQNHISVHHFCHNTPDSQLPLELVHVGRKYHTPDRFASVARAQRYRFRPGDVILSAECSSTDNSVRPNQESERINQATPMESSLTIWQKTAEKLLGETLIMVAGKMVDMGSNESQIYWNPAPPKLGTASDIVKEFLFPQYRVEGCEELFERHPVETMEKESNTNEDKGDTELDLEKKKLHERTVRKRHNSDNTKENSRKKNKKVDKYDCISDAQSCNSINEDQLDTNEKEQTYRRPVTAPSLLATNYETLIIPQDFNTALHEIKEQKKLLEKVKQMKHKEVEKRNHQTLGEAPDVLLKKDSIKFEIKNASEKVKEEPTPCEEAIQAGRNYIILPKKKKKKKGKRTLDKSKMIAAEQMLTTKNTKFIERRESMPMQHKIIERELRVSWQIRHRRFSMPSVLNFQEYKTRKRMPSEENEREWVRGIWNTWFDEVFPPTPHGSDEEEVNKEIIDKKIKKDTKEENNQLKKEVSQILSQDIEAIEPMKDTMENTEIYQKEITKLTHVINNIQTPTAFDYCRRGALYRKIGQLKKAECDLDRAINMEPDLLDAYWHRHLLYILQDKKTAALEDLNFIMKRNKSHAGAYRSMAEIHKQQDDITMAIINYSSAIKYNSLDHEAYFQRAQLYEKRGDMLLAMEDYTNAIKIMPYHTDAIMKHGLYYFENENWGNAINDFSELLKVEPFNVKARIFRARAYAKMMNWVASLQDLSATIHLDPNNWQAFYQRACILRKANPEKALLDLSVSLLLNDTEENIMSYLQRGILYNTLGKPEDAIQDFESVLKLNKDIAPAHVNLGLIFMNRHCNYHRAIKTFTAALKVDPTYVRAYVCRAEAYYKIHEMKNALKDFTKAIHLCPDVHYHYMYRGHLVLKMGQLELAAFCVSHASELGIKNPEKSFGGSASQQAVVHSFLNNFDKAVEALQQAARAQPTASTFMLLGKTHMKARQYKEAASSFNDALDKMKPWKKGDSWPKEAAEAHYLSGLCYMELRKFSEAQLQFNQAIKLNSSYADAYYQQGLASVKLKHPKGIQDFNRALALNPKIFQAYLSRACYYGQKGKYAKAILNCNEAIKLQPKCLRGYLYRGALKYWIKAYELAIQDLTNAASLDTECPIPYFNRAVCYHESGQHDKALTDYSIVLMLDSMLDLKVLVNRGLLYFERQDYINALLDLKAAAQLRSTDHRIQHTLGLCFHKLGRFKEAVLTFNKCLQLKPFFLNGFIARGNVYMDYGHKEGLILAQRDYQRAVRLDPLCLPAHINLAYAAQVSGQFMQAWKHFTSIIEVKAGYKPALEGRAIVNLQMGNIFGAFQDISLSISYGPSAELLTNRGVINQYMGESTLAMQDYQQALQIDPTFALAYYNAGNIYFHSRRFQQALHYYTMAIESNNQDESAYINRAITKVLLQDINGAFNDFEMAAKLCPFSAHIYFNRANLHASLGKFHDAEQDYCEALKIKPDDPMMLKKRADVRGHLGKQNEAIEDYKRAVAIQLRPNKLIVN